MFCVQLSDEIQESGDAGQIYLFIVIALCCENVYNII